MCNLYTFKLSREEVKHLLSHYKLIGKEWAEVFGKDMRETNESGFVYPKGTAPVVLMQDGEQQYERLKWGLPAWMPPPEPGKKPLRPRFVTNVRNTDSNWWKSWLAGAEVTVGKDKNHGGRCLVPASAFAEPDQNTSKPVVNRWFKRADGLPFFFAGVWREWTGDHGTIEKPDKGKHRLFGFLTTDASADVRPIHSKASPVILRSAADVEQWLTGTAKEALELQKPAAKKSLVVVPPKKAA
jgi:putative SOS response-associated peptidase YedK